MASKNKNPTLRMWGIILRMRKIGSQYQPAIYNKPITTNSPPITLKPLSDVEGLQRAYARTSGVYIRNTTMSVAGTEDFPQDHWDDVSKLPFQTTTNSLRYINADKPVTQNYALYPDHQITSLVGHSLAGSVIFEMQKQYIDINI